MTMVRSWRTVARGVVLAIIVTAIPLPALAADGSQPADKPALKAAVAKAAAAPKLSATRGQAGATDGKAQLGSPSFFKTPAGIIVLAVVAAGTGYALYSTRQDRIHSVVRANQ